MCAMCNIMFDERRVKSSGASEFLEFTKSQDKKAVSLEKSVIYRSNNTDESAWRESLHETTTLEKLGKAGEILGDALDISTKSAKKVG